MLKTNLPMANENQKISFCLSMINRTRPKQVKRMVRRMRTALPADDFSTLWL
ncbi:hypothetical protein KZP23_17245 [Echinicola marina]|uniref:hypothetical protein n=1 Tax=Echinicola marina TaxID=2859768 RepID=UPI001CF64A28|nr:hypothetical protein [Echinicola marina]UCS92427.1 hypothetical protein KZP23_17245 [Echinicola marina]